MYTKQAEGGLEFIMGMISVEWEQPDLAKSKRGCLYLGVVVPKGQTPEGGRGKFGKTLEGTPELTIIKAGIIPPSTLVQEIEYVCVFE